MTITQAADGNFDVVVADGNECTDKTGTTFSLSLEQYPLVLAAFVNTAMFAVDIWC